MLSKEALEKLSPYWLRQYQIFFCTGVGKMWRMLLSFWGAACFVEVQPAISIGFFLCGTWLFVSTIHKHVWGLYKFMYGPTPSQLVRSYNKIWRVAQKGPIQTKITVPSSQNTPQSSVKALTSSATHVALQVRRCMSSKTAPASARPVYTECNLWSTLWQEYLCRVGYTVTEEIPGEQDAIQLEVRAVRKKDWNNQFYVSARVHQSRETLNKSR